MVNDWYPIELQSNFNLQVSLVWLKNFTVIHYSDWMNEDDDDDDDDDNSEFTQHDGRKKRTAKRLCVTYLTWLLLKRFVVIFTFH